MGRKKKTPPAGLPRTQAELEHIKTLEHNEGAAHALEILLFVLADKFGWGPYDLQGLMARVMDQAQAITAGYATVHDLRKALKEEYGIEV